MIAALRHLAAALPRPEEAAAPDDPDRQCRAILAILVEAAIAAHEAPPPPIALRPGECPNCGAPASSDRSPYCGEACRVQAALIRQARGALESGAILDGERQAAIGERLWQLAGGGFPRRVERMSGRSLARILEKRPRCESCGAAAETVDHIGSG